VLIMASKLVRIARELAELTEMVERRARQRDQDEARAEEAMPR
jgi:hypothetical protein